MRDFAMQLTKTETEKFLQKKMVRYGQVVVGPPGCGKTTYCQGLLMFMKDVLQHTSACIVNLDFANDVVPYTPQVDIRDIIALEVSFLNKIRFIEELMLF